MEKAVSMIFVGRIQDKVGPRIIATIGGVLLGAAKAAASVTENAATATHRLVHNPQVVLYAGALMAAGMAILDRASAVAAGATGMLIVQGAQRTP